MNHTSILLLLILSTGILFTSCTKKKIENKCCSEDVAYFYENDSSYFTLPNVFSPNGDGVNDIFRGFGDGVETFHLSIFKNNLIKTKVFETNDINTSWDGTFNNRKLSESLYNYSLEVILKSGNHYSHKGTVCLVGEKTEVKSCENCRFPAQFNGNYLDPAISSGDEISCK